MRRTAFLLWLTGTALLTASPLTDLSSPSPEIRKQAAETIRDNHLYVPSDRKPWDDFVASIKPTDSDADVLDRLTKVSAHKVPVETNYLSVAGVMTYPLDDWWAINLTISGSHIIRLQIVEHAREIIVPAPTGFTGCWRTYRLDGSPVLHWYDQGRPIGPPSDYGDPKSPVSPTRSLHDQ